MFVLQFNLIFFIVLNVSFNFSVFFISAMIVSTDYDYNINEISVDQCCRKLNVPENCVEKLCNPKQPPDDFDVYDIFEKRNGCTTYLDQISNCLAAGRDHTSCCEREAVDPDENFCFSMCRGKGLNNHQDLWIQYQTCLAINIRPMFQCFLNGYDKASTPPLQLKVIQVKEHEVHLTWKKPIINTHLVKNYNVYIYQVDDDNDVIDESSELLFETEKLEIVIKLLESGVLYRAFVVAVTSKTCRSIKSRHVDFVTTGVAPIVEAFKPIVNVSRKANLATLACRFQINGTSNSKISTQWQFKNNLNEFVTLNSPRYYQTYFIYSPKPREYIALLEINDLNLNDFGYYRCTVFNEFGKSSKELELRIKKIPPPLNVPPLTPLACCIARSVDKHCLPMCGGMSLSSDNKQESNIPRPYMPPNCSNEISKVLSCALPEVDDSSCCLRKHVPRQCMYLCDSSINPSNHMAAVCLEHIPVIEQCRITGVQV